MADVDAQTINAYIDGELDSERRREFEAMLFTQPNLMREVQAARRYDALVRNAFAQVPEPARVPAQPSPRSHRNVILASAASVAALAFGVVIGLAASSRIETDSEPAYVQEQARSLQRALEREASGIAVSWVSPISDTRGEVMPVSTYRNADGEFCREFEQRRRRGGETMSDGGIACRDASGQWRIRIRYFP